MLFQQQQKGLSNSLIIIGILIAIFTFGISMILAEKIPQQSGDLTMDYLQLQQELDYYQNKVKDQEKEMSRLREQLRIVKMAEAHADRQKTELMHKLEEHLFLLQERDQEIMDFKTALQQAHEESEARMEELVLAIKRLKRLERENAP